MIFEGLVLARWVHFMSVFALFGDAVFWLVIRWERDALPWTSRQTTRLMRFAAPVAAVSGVAWLFATIANMTGDLADIVDPETLHAFFFETSFGPLAAARLLLLVALVVIAGVPLATWPRCAASAALSGLLLASQAWLGHAAEGGGTIYGNVMILAYAAHVLAGAAWIGSLVPLGLAIVELRRHADARAGTRRLLSRYSAMAVGAVSLIVASGIANTAFRVGMAPGMLVPTAYGRILGAKLVLVLVMLVIAAFNRVVVMPRLARSPSDAVAPGILEKSIALEGVLGLLVLSAAALLGVTAPPV